MTSRCRPRRSTTAVAPTPRWWRDASAVFAWGVTLFVVALWVAGGGLTAFGSLGEGAHERRPPRRALVASVLLLIQVLLMARIPFVEQACGQDELARLHRLVGFTSFNLMLAHIVLIDRSATAPAPTWASSPPSSTSSLHYPGMLLALAGTVALVMVVVTSVKKARARAALRVVAPAAPLRLPRRRPRPAAPALDRAGLHRRTVAATVFWWGLYAVALGRGPRLPGRSAAHPLAPPPAASSPRSSPRAPSVTSVVMTGRRLDRLPVRAGQFFQWRFLDGPGWTRGNPYSLSAAPDGRTPADHRRGRRRRQRAPRDAPARHPGPRRGPVRPPARRGPHQRQGRCSSVPASASRRCAPCSRSCPRRPAASSSSTGSAASPTSSSPTSCCDLARAKGGRVVAVVGHRNRERVSWLPVESRHLTDVEALTRIVPDIAERDVYVCGNPAWMDTVIAAAHEAGVPHDAVHHERFSY